MEDVSCGGGDKLAGRPDGGGALAGATAGALAGQTVEAALWIRCTVPTLPLRWRASVR